MAKVILFVGILGFVAQSLMTRGYQLGKPGRAAMMQNLTVVLGFSFETLVLHEYPSVIKILGATLVVVSSIKLVYD